MRINVLSITPQIAKDILERSNGVFKNRSLNKPTVNRYAEDMINGRWMLTGDPIKMDENGILLDGQHRLNALIKADKTIDFIVVEEIPIESVQYMDSGLRRSIEQGLQFNGVEFEKGVVSVVRKKMQLDKKIRGYGESNLVLGLTNAMIIDEYMNHKKLYDEAICFGKHIKKLSSNNLSTQDVGGIYAHLILSLNWDDDYVKTFFERIAHDPWTVYNIFTTTAKELSKAKNKEKINSYIQCWNSYIKGWEKKRFTDVSWFIENSENNNNVNNIESSENCVGVGVSSEDIKLFECEKP